MAKKNLELQFLKIDITNYLYNEDILMEFDRENALQRYYVHGLGIDDPLAMLIDNKETRNDPMDFKTYYYHKDGMSSITSLTDEDGKEKEKYIYNAFGKMTIYDERDNKIEESQIGNPYSFTGREHDLETGLHYHRARYYSPDLARWISEDPIEFGGGDMNLYRYVFNNPVIYIDLFGKKCTYYQATGRLTCTKAKLDIKAYSGKGKHKNNPASEGIKDQGPIPKGRYKIGGVQTHPNLGKFTFHLVPDNSTKAHIRNLGRNPNSFFIHGKRSINSNDDSKGCIVFSPKEIRKQLKAEKNQTLEVK